MYTFRYLSVGRSSIGRLHIEGAKKGNEKIIYEGDISNVTASSPGTVAARRDSKECDTPVDFKTSEELSTLMSMMRSEVQLCTPCIRSQSSMQQEKGVASQCQQ